MYSSGFKTIERSTYSLIEDELRKLGLQCRVFSRTKDLKSIQEKIQRKKEDGKIYTESGPYMQDLIGVRIVTYFIDDIQIVIEIIKNKFKPIDETVDQLDTITFKPKRTNIICELHEERKDIFQEAQNASSHAEYRLFQPTVEFQLRTILSEGWHEIDHNLRYKCKVDWIDNKEEERMLNGIYATLETNDVVMKKLFNDLTYQQYKKKNWEAFIRNKFRLQFQSKTLKNEIMEIFDNDDSLPKSILKADRIDIILNIFKQEYIPPINLNNLVYLYNMLYTKNESLLEITPEPIKEMIK